MNTPSRFRGAKEIISNIAVTETPTVISVLGRDCKIQSVSGNTWINSLGVATTTGDSFLLPTGASIDLTVSNDLSILSDATGSTVQILIYE